LENPLPEQGCIDSGVGETVPLHAAQMIAFPLLSGYLFSQGKYRFFSKIGLFAAEMAMKGPPPSQSSGKQA